MGIKRYDIRFVYSPKYNFKLHGLDSNALLAHLSKRYQNIADRLGSSHSMDKNNTYLPSEQYEEVIDAITTPEYRKYLLSSEGACSCFLRLNELIDESLVENILLDPMRRMCMGTLKATQLSFVHSGLTINLGGGFHHARRDSCGGFCIYNDFLASAQWLWEMNSKIRILYIDLDAHMGDGVLAECAKDSRFYHYDLYNTFTVERIDKERGRIKLFGLPLRSDDSIYLGILNETLEKMIHFSNPDFVFYNAGSDPLKGDELGQLNLSADGLKQRDALVFSLLQKYNIPSIMTLSGGYTAHSIEAVSRSIDNICSLSRMDKFG
jgi:histone deacetylase 11